MVYKSHYLELYVNGNRVEFESQDSINIRFQNVLYDPSKIASSQAEYSFEFELPCTPTNNRIFDYANELSKTNKFRSRWNAELYADGILIFKGTLTLNSVKDRMYSVNLVSVKVYSLEEIFGDAVMTDIKLPNGDNWEIPFIGAGFDTTPYTIDYYNKQCAEGRQNDVCFPLISYGVFTKDPVDKDDVGSTYTSKYDIDKYNRWYVETFYPSLNMLETMKKAFEWKGYTVAGDAFQDTTLLEVFLSTNLADGQDPTYNLGNPKFGKVELNVEWETPMNGEAYVQDLNFPYFRIGGEYDVDGKFVNSYYNFESVQIYDMLSEGNVTVADSTYLYQPNEHVIVIPADGFYKIELSGKSELTQSSTFQANQKYWSYSDNEVKTDGEVEIAIDFKKFTPFEVQLVRNYDDNLELIHGVNNFELLDGVPMHSTATAVTYQGGLPIAVQLPNYFSTYSNFPHEKIGSAYYHNAPLLDNVVFPWRYAPPTDITRFGDETKRTLYDFDEWNNVGYIMPSFPSNNIMGYDPSVSPIFICGFTSMGNENDGGCAAVIKNGYSWSPMTSEKYYSFYVQDGYYKAKTTIGSDGLPTWDYQMTPPHTQSKYEGNHGNNQCNGITMNYFTYNNYTINGKIQCIVKLNKGDKLQLLGVQRNYEHDYDQINYKVESEYHLMIEAYSPKSYDELMWAHYNWNDESQFDKNLNLANFFNKEKKVSEWIQNAADAFNLEFIQDGNSVEINTKKKYSFGKTAVDIDDRVNSKDAESSKIDYPRTMAVKYKIDKDEWGFERSAVANAGGDETILDRDGWEKYADSGYTVITLNDDTYVTSKSEKSLQFAYTWYWDFNWYEVDADGQQNPYRDPVVLNIPCISKFEYMVDGYGYDEAMKHDGYGLAQRFWYRPTPTECFVYTETYPKERISIYTTANKYNEVNLSYKDSERSLLSEYFNISAYLSSNYVTVDVYLTPIEYNRLRNGALCRFDKDLYEVVEIEGFDATGGEPTTLKLMKRTI